MKTQIIQLSQKEDNISVRDKISWCQTKRILLVWPRHGKVLNRKLDLILVRRYASSLGSELAFVTQDPVVLHDAGVIGIPVFEDKHQALEQDWKIQQQPKIHALQDFRFHDRKEMGNVHRSKTPAWLEHPVTRYTCLGISILAIVALLLFYLPGAKVVLNPREEFQSMKLDLIADPNTTAANLATGTLPTYTEEVVLEGSENIPASGLISIPDKPAKGSLKFTNNTKHDIAIPIGTIVTTGGNAPIRFRTISDQDVVIKPNQSQLIDAQALQPGSVGNLEPNSLTAVEGTLGMNVNVSNPNATSGGLDVQIRSPNQQDLQSARNRLREKLEQEAIVKFRSILPANDVMLIPSLTTTEVLEETSIPIPGEPGEQLELHQRVIINAKVVAGELIQNRVTPMLDSSRPAGYQAINDSLQITTTSDPMSGTDGKIHWTVSVTRRLKAEISSSLAAETVKGATLAGAVERLAANMPLAKEAQISLIPSWWPRLPFLAMRINVIQEETQ